MTASLVVDRRTLRLAALVVAAAVGACGGGGGSGSDATGGDVLSASDLGTSDATATTEDLAAGSPASVARGRRRSSAM